MDIDLASSWQQAEGRPVRSLTAGTPEGGLPELVLVPGLGALGYLVPTVKACGRWTRVHLLDIPGFGHRVTARCPSTVADVAETVAAWLRSAPVERVLLMGHSTGAQAALRAAIAVPERVAGLVLAGPTFPPQARRWRPLVTRVAATLRHEPPALVRATFPEYSRGRSRVVTLLRTAMQDEPEDRISRVRCPVLVIRGEHDALSPLPWATLLAGRAPAGQAVTVPGAHNFVFNQAGAAASILHVQAVDLADGPANAPEGQDPARTDHRRWGQAL